MTRMANWTHHPSHKSEAKKRRGKKYDDAVPGSKARRSSDSPKAVVGFVFGRDGSRLRFRQVWLAQDGSEHRARRGAVKASPKGFLPHLSRHTR